MLTDRKKEIYDLLCDKKNLSVSALSRQLYVCEMTIRRDLKEMERGKLLARYHGGAMLLEEQYALPLRRLVEADNKKQLVKKAAAYLKDNALIFLDASSTCSYLIPYMENLKNIRVITNAVEILPELHRRQIPCLVTGGDFRGTEMCMSGPETEDFLRRYNPDLAFLSSMGISEDGYITDIDEPQTRMRRIVIQNSAQTILILGSSKHNRRFPYTLCHREDVAEVITAP